MPKFTVVESGADLIGFIKQNGYPVLTKPRSARRSLGIQILHNDWELKCLLDRGIRATSDSFPNMMVEEFVEANMYHVDGLVVNGHIKFIWPSEYITKCDGFEEGKHIASISLASDNIFAENLIHYVKTVIDALPSPENFAFHAEVFRTSTGELKLCEIAARPGAGPVVAAFEQIFHIDIKRLAILSSIMGADDSLQMPARSHPDGLCGWLIFPNQFLNCSLKRVPQNCPIQNVCSYRTFAQEGDKFGNERVVLAEIIVSARDLKSAQDAIMATLAWFYDHVEYGQ